MQMFHLVASAPAPGPLFCAVSRALGEHPAALAASGLGLSRDAAQRLLPTERLFGTPMQGLAGFFGMAGRRAERFLRRMDGPAERLVIFAAPQDRICEGLWRQLRAAGEADDFASCREAILRCGRGWAEVVEEVVEALEPQEVVVIPDTGAPATLPSRPALAAALEVVAPGAGLDAADAVLALLPAPARAMVDRVEAQGGAMPAAQLERILRWHSRAPAPAESGLTPEEASLLRRRFAADLDLLDGIDRVRIAGFGRGDMAAQ